MKNVLIINKIKEDWREIVSELLKPLIPQRADPFIYKHTDGYYYFTASVPQYDRIELRRAKTIAELANAPTVDAWHKPETGPYSELLWAPEIHFNKDPESGESAWYVYFAAAPSREIKFDLFQHRMYCVRNKNESTPGSRSPLRVAIITPPAGVNPMLLSIL